MREAVIVSTARTGIGRAFRGALNHTKSPTMVAHAITHAVQRAGIEGAEVEDAIIGCVLTAGTAGMNLARHSVIAAGLPVSVSGQTMDRNPAPGQISATRSDSCGGQRKTSAIRRIGPHRRTTGFGRFC
ncbi:hypothetical protein GmRootV118_03140 [Variovorax sp. V118]|uniref:thiolase family protein n=1 Tax=Variovorax sp. V118 TaxID=3065954 RepID=UPI0034E85DFB